MQGLSVGPFLQGSLNHHRLVHPAIQTAPPPDLSNDVVDPNVVGCLQLGKSCLFDLVNLGDAEEFIQQLLVGLGLNEDDELVTCVVKVDSGIIEGLLGEGDIGRQDGDFLSIFLFVVFGIVNEIAREGFFVVDVEGEWVDPGIVLGGKEVGVGGVQLEVLVHP